MIRRALWDVVIASSVLLAVTSASAQPATTAAPTKKAPAKKKAPPPTAPVDPYAPPPVGPTDPYAVPEPPVVEPAPAPLPAPLPLAPEIDTEAVLAEQVAQSLVARAQELYDARVFVDAKQLALEALQKSPKGAAGEHARYLVRESNKQLGLPDQPLPGDPMQVEVTAVEDPSVKVTDEPLPQPERPSAPTQIAARVHGGLYFGLLGATVGAIANDETAGVAVPIGIGGGLVGALVTPRIEARLGWTEAQTRTVGSGSVWGGVIGGFMGDAVKRDGTTGRHVLVGASIGSSLGVLAGAGIASQKRFTRGDVALVDTLAGIGTVSGLTLGMLMQPAEGEAYSVNAIVGATVGYLTGFIAAPLTNTTPRRMVRVMGASLVGGTAPFLLYAAMYDSATDSDERTVGFLSTAGLVIGAYVGIRLTRGMDEDLDTHDGKRKTDPDALGLVHRHSDGHWALGTIGIQPLSPQLAPQPGASIPIVGATW